DVSAARLHTGQLATDAENVKLRTIYRRRTARTVSALVAAQRHSIRDLLAPSLVARLLVQRPDHFILPAKAHAVDAPFRDGDGSVTLSHFRRFPGELRSGVRPFLQETGIGRKTISINSAPLRIVRRQRGHADDRHQYRHRSHVEEGR